MTRLEYLEKEYKAALHDDNVGDIKVFALFNKFKREQRYLHFLNQIMPRMIEKGIDVVATHNDGFKYTIKKSEYIYYPKSNKIKDGNYWLENGLPMIQRLIRSDK